MFINRTVDTIFALSPSDGERFDALFIANALAFLREEGIDLAKTIIKTEQIPDGIHRLVVRRAIVNNNYFESSDPVPMKWAE